jgi:hypothetical protein
MDSGVKKALSRIIGASQLKQLALIDLLQHNVKVHKLPHLMKIAILVKTVLNRRDLTRTHKAFAHWVEIKNTVPISRATELAFFGTDFVLVV